MHHTTYISTQHFLPAGTGGQQRTVMLQLERGVVFAPKRGFFPEVVLLLIHNMKTAKTRHEKLQYALNLGFRLLLWLSS